MLSIGGEVGTDEGIWSSYLSCLDPADINEQVGLPDKFPNLKPEDLKKVSGKNAGLPKAEGMAENLLKIIIHLKKTHLTYPQSGSENIVAFIEW